MNKIYCKDCEHYEYIDDYGDVHECNNPDFLTKRDYLGNVIPIRCAEQNKNCDCGGFEKRKSFWERLNK